MLDAIELETAQKSNSRKPSTSTRTPKAILTKPSSLSARSALSTVTSSSSSSSSTTKPSTSATTSTTRPKTTVTVETEMALRKKLVHLMAPKPIALADILKKLGYGVEERVVEMLPLISKTQSNGQLTLRHQTYKEVHPYTWTPYTFKDRELVVQNARIAFSLLKIPQDAPEWKNLSPPSVEDGGTSTPGVVAVRMGPGGKVSPPLGAKNGAGKAAIVPTGKTLTTSVTAAAAAGKRKRAATLTASPSLVSTSKPVAMASTSLPPPSSTVTRKEKAQDPATSPPKPKRRRTMNSMSTAIPSPPVVSPPDASTTTTTGNVRKRKGGADGGGGGMTTGVKRPASTVNGDPVPVDSIMKIKIRKLPPPPPPPPASEPPQISPTESSASLSSGTSTSAMRKGAALKSTTKPLTSSPAIPKPSPATVVLKPAQGGGAGKVTSNAGEPVAAAAVKAASPGEVPPPVKALPPSLVGRYGIGRVVKRGGDAGDGGAKKEGAGKGGEVEVRELERELDSPGSVESATPPSTYTHLRSRFNALLARQTKIQTLLQPLLRLHALTRASSDPPPSQERVQELYMEFARENGEEGEVMGVREVYGRVRELVEEYHCVGREAREVGRRAREVGV
ncbi:hypothetical protein HDU67_009689 [Dinochytrium kinnereticum]|nr:hypothetical protein HDU67_009689 [Dinochytrium kinnereticum]